MDVALALLLAVGYWQGEFLPPFQTLGRCRGRCWVTALAFAPGKGITSVFEQCWKWGKPKAPRLGPACTHSRVCSASSPHCPSTNTRLLEMINPEQQRPRQLMGSQTPGDTVPLLSLQAPSPGTRSQPWGQALTASTASACTQAILHPGPWMHSPVDTGYPHTLPQCPKIPDVLGEPPGKMLSRSAGAASVSPFSPRTQKIVGHPHFCPLNTFPAS